MDATANTIVIPYLVRDPVANELFGKFFNDTINSAGYWFTRLCG
jgi:hypothetical protein